MQEEFKTEIDGKPLLVQIKNLAEQANGEVWITYGQTTVLATCVISQEERNVDFLPLTVNYEERYYAAGRIGGSRYIRREGRPSDVAILKSRLIDRTIRPCFPEESKREVQVIITCLSWDGENDPDIVGLLAASLALSISDIPWNGPIAAVRVIGKNGEFALNPSYHQREEAQLDIIFAGKEVDGEFVINMIEAEALEATEESTLESFDFAKKTLKELLEFQRNIQGKIGKEKLKIDIIKNVELERKIKEKLEKEAGEYLYGKMPRKEKEELLWKIKEEIRSIAPEKEQLGFEIFKNKARELLHKYIIRGEKRPDGRKPEETREISCQAGILPRAHGSGLFIRGNTKALSILTLGAPGDQRLLEEMETVGKKRFMHHYNFPPYSVGEVKPLTSPGRREIGHGMLAEKALLPLIPTFEEFPYTIRVVSEILSSNGSTSMASVSSSCLALMDGGVPIKKPVAGIAIGLIREGKDYKILADIQGPEDQLGDMDFKVAGTKEGVTALQLDTKIDGINEDILKQTLFLAKNCRLQILGKMEEILKEPRASLSPFAPRICTLRINPDRIGDLIGPKGKTIKEIIEKTEATIDVDPTGLVFITADKEEAAKAAISWIKNVTREIKIGEDLSGKVKRILKNGVIVVLEGGQEGLIPRSRLPGEVRIGDTIRVRVVSNNDQGKPILFPNPSKEYGRRKGY